MRRLVSVRLDGKTGIHLPGSGSGDYTTLCGLDGDDPKLEQEIVSVSVRALVDCQVCAEIWKKCQEYSYIDFVTGLP